MLETLFIIIFDIDTRLFKATNVGSSMYLPPPCWLVFVIMNMILVYPLNLVA